jgi:CheY-like chemotaxis protein
MTRSATSPTVLLVEDEPLISQLVADWLSDHGFAVREATSGAEALAYLDGGGEVDVLFTDINLLGGIDGTELAKRVRARRPDLPVVYTSGRSGYPDLGTSVPRSVFVPKPYSPAEVCRLIGRLTAH